MLLLLSAVFSLLPLILLLVCFGFTLIRGSPSLLFHPRGVFRAVLVVPVAFLFVPARVRTRCFMLLHNNTPGKAAAKLASFVAMVFVFVRVLVSYQQPVPFSTTSSRNSVLVLLRPRPMH